MEKTAVTVQIDREVMQALDRLLRGIGLRRDAYLNRVLEDEIDRLAEREANSEEGERLLRFRSQQERGGTVKVGLRLDTSLAAKITAVCAEKRVPRDLFFQAFLRFLASGYEDPDPFKSCVSPLAKAMELLRNPYWETDADIDLYGEECFVSEASLRALDAF